MVSAVPGIAVGLLVLLLLFPASGTDQVPPTCFSALGYEVSCSTLLSSGGAVVATAVIAILVWTVLRPRPRRRR